ncbi:IS630 family transposase [Streptomyces sp. NPDC088170]|uniref:IS630 family transposase n=1 Tax=Streptomyces sp. NPDC088170 TaxID=3365834 RepID=UPI0038307A40
MDPGTSRAVVTRATRVVLSRAPVWRLLTDRLGWSLQRPERRAIERNESEIARWIAHEWPRIKKGAVNTRAWIVFLDESGVSLLPQIRRTSSPRGRTPLLRHRLNWKRASMAGAMGYHSADPHHGARLCFHLKPGSYDTTGLIEVLERMKVFYSGERVVLVWDGLSAHWSRAMRAWVAEQDWLTLERLPAYAPELNPVELLWSSPKKRELAHELAWTTGRVRELLGETGSARLRPTRTADPTRCLLETGAASVGSVSDSYDNAMAEALNGTFKAEPIELHGPLARR